jgi:nucleotide-binding universal stress UspA family protein
MNILVATDFSGDSGKALDEGVKLARRLNAIIFLMHAIDAIDQCSVDYCLNFEDVEATKEKLIREAREKLDEEIMRVDARDISIIPEVRYGRTYEEIIKDESEKYIDLLVVGQHGRRSFWNRMATHLSTRLVKNPARDILVVHHAA